MAHAPLPYLDPNLVWPFDPNKADISTIGKDRVSLQSPSEKSDFTLFGKFINENDALLIPHPESRDGYLSVSSFQRIILDFICTFFHVDRHCRNREAWFTHLRNISPEGTAPFQQTKFLEPGLCFHSNGWLIQKTVVVSESHGASRTISGHGCFTPVSVEEAQRDTVWLLRIHQTYTIGTDPEVGVAHMPAK